jgi:hypothetical protein
MDTGLDMGGMPPAMGGQQEPAMCKAGGGRMRKRKHNERTQHRYC